MKKCIFDEYFTDGKECNRDYDCDFCEIKEELRKRVGLTFFDGSIKKEGEDDR